VLLKEEVREKVVQREEARLRERESQAFKTIEGMQVLKSDKLLG